jgi:hypothetical protein
MTDLTVLVVIALTLAVALFGMVTRLIVPLARGLWREQTAAVAARVSVLQAARLPRSHRRPARMVRAVVRMRRLVVTP